MSKKKTAAKETIVTVNLGGSGKYMCSLATMFGIGNIKPAPGTWGSLAATLLAYPVLLLPVGWVWLLMGVGLLTILGSRAAHAYMHAHRIKEDVVLHDPSNIVVDEWAGQWLTFSTWHLWLVWVAGTPEAANYLLGEVAHSPLHLFYGFVLFRFFDIMKPWPIRLADRKIKGGFGVVFDDLLAGIAAGTILFGIYFFAPLISGQMMESHI